MIVEEASATYWLSRGAANMTSISTDHEICHGCHGRGWVVAKDRAQLCPICGGKGYVPRDPIRKEVKDPQWGKP